MNKKLMTNSVLILVFVLIYGFTAQPVMAETVSWEWEAGDCYGSPGGILNDQTIVIEPNTEVCVLPPSYLLDSLRVYDGIHIDSTYFPQTSSPNQRCKTVTSSSVLIESDIDCSTASGRVRGTIKYTPAATSLPSSWAYDFYPSEDISALTVVNPTGIPTYSLTDTPGTLQMNIPSRTGSFYNGYDLASQVNYDALRLYRSGGGEAFTLETKLFTSSSGYTYLSGLYLFSNDGNFFNDLVYGASPDHLKIDRGNGDWTISSWYPIGTYDDGLFLQVVCDGLGNYMFNYKKSVGDGWSNYMSLSGFSFDNFGIITKTWGTGPGAPSPAVTANFDYLYYNYTAPPGGVVQPGGPDVTITEEGNANVDVQTDTDPSDGIVSASVGASVYAYGSADLTPVESIGVAQGSLPFTVNDPQNLSLNVSIGGLMGGDHLFMSRIEVEASITEDGVPIATFVGNTGDGLDYSISLRPLPYGFEEVTAEEEHPYTAQPGKQYTLEFYQRLYAGATGSLSSAFANFGGSTVFMISDKSLVDFPVADAGMDQTVEAGAIVQLDGSGSTDPGQNPLTYKWTQVGGDIVTLSNPSAEKPTFEAITAGLYGFELVVNNGTLDSLPDYVNVLVQEAAQEIEITIDIKPGSYPNCFNINGHGVIPVAILGSADFDVTQVDLSSLEFAGLEVRVKGNETPQCSYEDVSGDFTSPEGAPDGYLDLVCQFVDNPAAWLPNNGTATLTGNLKEEHGGTPITGTDELCIVP